jgi:hypothetical protein
MPEPPASVADLLTRDHRRLDDLFGRFLGAADHESAVRAIGDFDAALRVHTGLEEDHLFPFAPGGKLAAPPDESVRDRLFRELSLEHVQIRELSGMIVRQIGEGGDPRAAFALAGNLARRWDEHTLREENEAYPALVDALGAEAELELRRELSGERKVD